MMMRTLLKRDESYAIHALIYMAENPGSRTQHIAESLAMPPAFMAKVIHKLTRSGLVKSKQGRNGGVSVGVDLGKLSMLDVIEAISGPVVMDTCQTQEQCITQQRQGHCQLKHIWFSTGKAIRQTLAEVSLQMIVDENRQARKLD
nr:Rrf2 family transcriptional regulator [uncultured bacterium]